MFAEPKPAGFGFSDTAFRIFILMASRRLKSDRFFTVDYTPRVYTPEGIAWIDATDMSAILRRHVPELGAGAARASRTPSRPWDRPSAWSEAGVNVRPWSWMCPADRASLSQDGIRTFPASRSGTICCSTSGTRSRWRCRGRSPATRAGSASVTRVHPDPAAVRFVRRLRERYGGGVRRAAPRPDEVAAGARPGRRPARARQLAVRLRRPAAEAEGHGRLPAERGDDLAGR